MNFFTQRPAHMWMIFFTLLISMSMLVLPHPLLFVILALVPIGLFIVVRLSVVMVLLFIIFSLFRLHEVFPFLMPYKLPLLLALASLFVFAMRIAILRDLKVDWPKELVVLSAYLFIVFLGILFANNKPEAINYIKETYIKIYLMTLIGYWMLKKPSEFKTLLIFILAAGFIIAIKAISNKLMGIGVIEGSRITIARELGSALGDPNDLALVVMFPLAYSISTFIHTNKSIVRYFAGLLALLLITSIVFTQSRGGIIGAASIVAFYSYHHIKSKVAFVSISAIIFVILVSASGLSDRETTQLREGALDASAQGRLYAWEAAWDMALDNPVLGVGIENYYFNYFYYTPYWNGKNHVVHSTWLNVMAETGFAGFALFMGMVYLLFLRARQISNKITPETPNEVTIMCYASMPALLGFSVAGTFLTQSYTWPLYLQMVIILSLYRYLQEN